ncbi:unnamed protein product [Rhizophagus irregularis]|nr:unnamed protein product [Rhizophagus irregularis]
MSDNDVDIVVLIDDQQPVLVNLDPENKLSKIRKTLKENSVVSMDDTLSFAKEERNNNNSSSYYSFSDEENIILKDIIRKEILHLTKTTVGIIVKTVKTDNPPMQVFVILNLNDKLSKIRESLIQNSLIHMDNSLSFAKNNYELVKDEEKILGEIINMQDKILYLTTTMRECCNNSDDSQIINKIKAYFKSNDNSNDLQIINKIKEYFKNDSQTINKIKVSKNDLQIINEIKAYFKNNDDLQIINEIKIYFKNNIYLAKWKSGPLYWNINEKKYINDSNKTIILKYLNNSNDLQIINEIKVYFKNILQIINEIKANKMLKLDINNFNIIFK